VQIYHRKQSTTQTAKTAQMQIDSQELWGRAAQNYFQSHIPKVKAFRDRLPQTDGIPTDFGIEFNTEVEPDRNTKPGGVIYWSGEREGVRNEDGYAKIKVKIRYCNQLEKVYIADD
jgi:hypothetical protein